MFNICVSLELLLLQPAALIFSNVVLRVSILFIFVSFLFIDSFTYWSIQMEQPLRPTTSLCQLTDESATLISKATVDKIWWIFEVDSKINTSNHKLIDFISFLMFTKICISSLLVTNLITKNAIDLWVLPIWWPHMATEGLKCG